MSVLNIFNVGSAGTALPCVAAGSQFALRRNVNLADNNAGVGDVIKLVAVPAKTLVQDVIANVVTEEGAAQTFNVGDFVSATDAAIDADGYLAAADGNALGATKTSDLNTLGHFGGKFYVDDTAYIGLTAIEAGDAAEVEVTVICVDCR